MEKFIFQPEVAITQTQRFKQCGRRCHNVSIDGGKANLVQHMHTVQVTPQAQAMLTAGDPAENARTILRNALPNKKKPVRKI